MESRHGGEHREMSSSTSISRNERRILRVLAETRPHVVWKINRDTLIRTSNRNLRQKVDLYRLLIRGGRANRVRSFISRNRDGCERRGTRWLWLAGFKRITTTVNRVSLQLQEKHTAVITWPRSHLVNNSWAQSGSPFRSTVLYQKRLAHPPELY